MTGTTAEVVDWVVGDAFRHRGTPTALRATPDPVVCVKDIGSVPG